MVSLIRRAVFGHSGHSETMRIALIFGLALIAGVPAAVATSAGRPAVRIVDLQPVVLKGSDFASLERVRLTVGWASGVQWRNGFAPASAAASRSLSGSTGWGAAETSSR